MSGLADAPQDGLLAAGLDATELPSALVVLLARLRREEVTCEALARNLARVWRLPEPYGTAAIAIAREADRSGTRNPYHNPAHSRDVAVNWANLAVLNAGLAAKDHAIPVLGAPDLGLGLCAAFGHDLLHDGLGNTADAGTETGDDAAERTPIPFRLESVAAERVAAIMTSCGLRPESVAPVVAAILATDPLEGFAALTDTPPPGRGNGVHPAFGALDHPAWRMMAVLLRDADLLASVGLTAAEHDRQSTLLSREVGVDFTTPAAAETLFDMAEAERFGSSAGQLFLPQFRALRALNRVRRRAAGTLSLAEAARRVAGDTGPDR